MKLYDYMPVSKLVEELEIRDTQIEELERAVEKEKERFENERWVIPWYVDKVEQLEKENLRFIDIIKTMITDRYGGFIPEWISIDIIKLLDK